MRFARLDFVRYGHLTDVRVDLPTRMPDLYILVGPNEVGKSTAQAALADLLFGFGHKTDYAFLHQERDLRVGALIEHDGVRREVWRRKGRKDTLRNGDDTPLDEAVLDEMRFGVAEKSFLNQFSLNHERLRVGGRAILEDKDDFSRMLFQAAEGLDWLSQRLSNLDREAQDLFKPKGSSQLLPQALRRRKEASDALHGSEVRLTKGFALTGCV